MEENIEELRKKFRTINENGWVRNLYNGNGRAGRTFEHLIGNSENSLEIPDFKDIEIKTKFSTRNRYINLFNCKSESHFYNDTERLKDNFGYPDNNFKKYRVLNTSVYNNKKVMVNNKYFFQLRVNKNCNKVYLYIYDKYYNLIDKESYWDFSDLKEKLYRNLKILAYIKLEKKVINKIEYFNYYDLKIYHIKDFETFINLIENGIIRVTFKVGIYKYGKKFGQTYNHGTGFEIKENDLLKLYELIK